MLPSEPAGSERDSVGRRELPTSGVLSPRAVFRPVSAARLKLLSAGRADQSQAARAEPTGDAKRTPRAVDNEADALHAAVLRRLADHELLAAHDPAAAASTGALRAALYPAGGDFLRGDMLTR